MSGFHPYRTLDRSRVLNNTGGLLIALFHLGFDRPIAGTLDPKEVKTADRSHGEY